MPTPLWTALHQGVLADRPAATSARQGYVFFATDVHGGTLYQCDGSTWVQIAAALDGSSYTLPVATSSTRGGIKPGRGLIVTADGTLLPHDLSAEQIASVAASVVRGAHTLPDAVLSGNVPLLVGGLLPAADLPLATTGAAGAVKVGRGLVISSDGMLRPQDVAADQIASVAAGSVAGILAPNRGGTGLDTSAVTDGQVLVGQSSDHSLGLATLTAGAGITVTNAGHTVTITATGGGGSGTVTSVALTVPSFLSVAGSPITTSGTLAVTLATQSAGTLFAGPASGSAAAPTFRAMSVADVVQPVAAGALLAAAATCI